MGERMNDKKQRVVTVRLPMLTSLRRKTWKPVLFQGCPSWQQAAQRVVIEGDLRLRSFAELDYLFAIFASNAATQFHVTATGTTLTRWLLSVQRRSVGAAEKYEKRMRAHFRRYKCKFTEGYTLPGPPTPELRVIYDSSASSENRPRTPCGTTLHCGFSGGAYHWRKWPLHNVVVTEATKE